MPTSKNDWDGKERRSGRDRRQTERRHPERRAASGVLSTREGERRKTSRRQEDSENPEPKTTDE